ncbi:hypothetical protein ACOAQZ_29435 [Pseudomonas aeruginosa]|uniref:hypothetical protein n=1 Tax=Pseudomonas aeruginosa TaxID=287 RepID=UPI000281ACE7|nr:hypothetical protein [Pseudomonas aeruginosa]EKA57087.1 hypothetical protein PAE2_0707 [Pseudomonas aeruginosa E2]EKU4819910.1 hypothetical protein [Pseudomonas aeruginosa]EKU7350773.1 hypothetical protein [Pseudomonas aeruginosa]EKU9479094.1 hypothetical protein [Pseudomonas aeruginosa]EKW1994457.1 hypothetical protein [Pseudomonas aeruginosa]
MEKNDAVDALIAAMTDDRVPVPIRIGAARGLAHIGSAHVRDELVTVMTNQLCPMDLRAAAAEALGQASA